VSPNTCRSRVCVAVLSLNWFVGHAMSAQNGGPNGGPIDRLAESREYDPVVDFSTDTATFRVDGHEGITIQFVTGHPGTTPRALKAVELLIIRDLSQGRPYEPDNVDERDVTLLVDGERFERRGTLNPRLMDRPRTAAVAMVFRADAFSRFAHVTSVEGHAFGCDFALAPDQLTGLQSIMQQWIASAR
jgi:hypothetical protein